MNEQIFMLNSQKKTTNHILHLILTLLTGVWLLVWIVIAFNNSSHNRSIQGKMNRVLNYRIQGMDDVQTYRQIKADRERHDSIKRKVLFVIGVVVLVWLYTKTL